MTNSRLMDRSEKKSISGMQLQETSKTGNDTGYTLSMAVQLGKTSLQFWISHALCLSSPKSLVAE